MDNDSNRNILLMQDSRTVPWFPVSSVMCLGAYIVSEILSEYSYGIEIGIFVVVFLAAAFVENSIRKSTSLSVFFIFMLCFFSTACNSSNCNILYPFNLIFF